ncbi:MAG: transglutaminase-like domain-containing protein [Chitinophagales bacterium]
MNETSPIDKKYLEPTKYVDSDHPAIIKKAEEIVEGLNNDKDKAVALYYYVRDSIRYNPYEIDLSEEALKASTVFKRGYGFCVEKANLLAAFARSQGIPARFGFADVKNHLSSPRLIKALRSEVFAFHGYTELFINGKWVKATPAFNRELCVILNVKPLEFNGEEDSIFQEFDSDGKAFMVYLKDHGIFHDIPRAYMIEVLQKHYPHLFTSGKISFSETGDQYFFKT